MDIKQEMIDIRKRISKVLFKFEEVSTMEGTILIYDGDIKEGIEVYVYDENGEKVPAIDGDYTIESVGLITVKEGKIVMIKPIESEPQESENVIVEQSAENLETIVETNLETIEEVIEKEDPNKDILIRLEESEKNIKNILEILDKLFNTVEEFSKQPVATKIEKIVLSEGDIINNKQNKALKYFNK